MVFRSCHISRRGPLLCVLAAACLPAWALNLTFNDKLPAPNGNIVELRSIGANPLSGESAADDGKYIAIGSAGDAYRVTLKNIEHDGTNQYFTYEFLISRTSGNLEPTRVLFNVAATGSFADFYKDVPFTVVDNASRVPGSITIPVYSLNPLPVCKVNALPTKSKPLPVFLGGDTEYTVSLDCTDADALPRIVELRGPSAHEEYWNWKKTAYQSQYYGPNGPTRPLTVKSFDLLTTVLNPDALSAIGARFRRMSSTDSPDDTIVFDLTYAVRPAGLPIPMKIEIPITFYPSPPVTAGALFLGVLSGWIGSWLLMLAVGKSKPTPTVLRAFLLGCFLAVIAFVLVLLAYTANCRLQLFGLDMNPFDVLVLFAMGFICGCAGLLKAEELSNQVDRILEKIRPKTASVAGLALLIFGGLFFTEGRLAGETLSLVGLAACPEGHVVGLHENGTVIQFSTVSMTAWRPIGRISPEYTLSELTCAQVGDKFIVFVAATVLKNLWVIGMDVATGTWTKALVKADAGASAGLAHDHSSGSVFLASPRDRAIYQVSDALQDPKQWVSIFGDAESISSLAVDSVGQRLFVGESFSGTVYSVATDTHIQSLLVQGMGSVNSLSIDQRRNLLYIADGSRRSVWVAPLSQGGASKPSVFYHTDVLKGITGVAADSRSNVWVSFKDSAQVIRFGPDGTQLGVYR